MSSKEFTAKIFKWLYQINQDADLLPVDVKVAVQLTWHFREADEEGRAYPGYRCIADAIKVSKPTVIRSVQSLHKHGYLRIEWGHQGRGHPNQYWLTLKDEADAVDKRSTDGPFAASVKGPPVNSKGPPVDQNHLKNHCGTVTQSRKGERDATASHPPPSPPLTRGSGGRQTKKESQHIAAANPGADRFAELRAVWVRKWHDDDVADRQAFQEACHTADPQAIIDAAKRWVKAIDNPQRFLPSLVKWFAGGWERPPPPKKHRAAGRGGKGYRKPDLAKVMLRVGAGWEEDEDGNITNPETGHIWRN